MLNSNYLFTTKYNNLHDKLTFLRNISNREIKISCSGYMVFSFKKFLKLHKVKYTVWKNRPGYIVVNQPNFPRLIFDFCDLGYVRIIKIPQDKYEYLFVVGTVKNLIIKMFRHRLIDIATLKRLEKDRKKGK